MLELPGLRFYSLQQGAAAAPLTADPKVVDLAPHCRDLQDLAATLTTLDLLLTADTMPAHLAGALGVPVWLLLEAAPDWRWLRARSDSPWYPTMRIFRQAVPGAWDEVATAVRLAMLERLEQGVPDTLRL